MSEAFNCCRKHFFKPTLDLLGVNETALASAAERMSDTEVEVLWALLHVYYVSFTGDLTVLNDLFETFFSGELWSGMIAWWGWVTLT